MPGSPFVYGRRVSEPPGSFSHRGAHPEERSDEGSQRSFLALLVRMRGRMSKSTLTPQIIEAPAGIRCFTARRRVGEIRGARIVC